MPSNPLSVLKILVQGHLTVEDRFVFMPFRYYESHRHYTPRIARPMSCDAGAEAGCAVVARK